MIYKEVTSLEYLEALADKDPGQLVCYDTVSAWWCLLSENPYHRGPLPCSPHGSVLLQAPLSEFIGAAKSNEDNYGKFGLDTFMASYEFNITEDGASKVPMDERYKGNTIWRLYEMIMEHTGPTDPTNAEEN